MTANPPPLFTVFSPALLHVHEIRDALVVIIDVLRATSTIATALYNGADAIIPVDSVSECIELSRKSGAISAGERDGKIADGLQHGNSPLEYPRDFIAGKKLVLTTTNGTRLLHMALASKAGEIITGSFPNLSRVADYLSRQQQPVILACAGWKDRVNLEDMLFAGAVVDQVAQFFDINCDSSQVALSMYKAAGQNLYGFMQEKQASHFIRLSKYGLMDDIRYCLTPDLAPVLPVYREGSLVAGS
jgi:2-phosphosulfolactate phosphatase